MAPKPVPARFQRVHIEIDHNIARFLAYLAGVLNPINPLIILERLQRRAKFVTQIENRTDILAERGGFEPPIEVLAPITV